MGDSTTDTFSMPCPVCEEGRLVPAADDSSGVVSLRTYGLLEVIPREGSQKEGIKLDQGMTVMVYGCPVCGYIRLFHYRYHARWLQSRADDSGCRL